MIPNMQAYYQMINDHHISLIYNGPIWAEGVEGIGDAIKKRLEFDELPVTVSQSVFSVFIEQMYNMLNYAADKEVFHSESKEKDIWVAPGIFVLGIKEKQYFIQCGNKIKDEKIHMVKEKIDYLNTLDKQQIRKYYRTCLKADNKNADSQGAGLGLIEIAKRSSSPMKYEFTPLNERGYSFFSLYVTVG